MRVLAGVFWPGTLKGNFLELCASAAVRPACPDIRLFAKVPVTLSGTNKARKTTSLSRSYLPVPAQGGYVGGLGPLAIPFHWSCPLMGSKSFLQRADG